VINLGEWLVADVADVADDKNSIYIYIYTYTYMYYFLAVYGGIMVYQ